LKFKDLGGCERLAVNGELAERESAKCISHDDAG
jgi:hypothetical protein